MKNIFAKVLLFLVLSLFFFGCDAVKRVPNGQFLLKENIINVNDTLVKNAEVKQIILQQPNSRFLKLPIALHIHNLAIPNADSVFFDKFIKDTVKFNKLSKVLSEKQVYQLGESFWYKGRHNFFKKIGEAPVIIESTRSKRSLQRLQQYYFNQGYFNNFGTFSTYSIANKKAIVSYDITLGTQYTIDSISHEITSIDLDSIYTVIKNKSYIKSNEPYNSENFEKERNRLTQYFRNNGVNNFQKNNVIFQIDTINTNKKVNVRLLISDNQSRSGDSITYEKFVVSKIKKIQVFVDQKKTTDETIQVDTLTYNGINFFSFGKLQYKPQALSNAIFLKIGQVYSDEKVSQTNQVISNLKMFNFPIIRMERLENPDELVANIYLQSKKRYGFGWANDIIHNNIQQVGLIGNMSVTFRNLFQRAETLEFGLRANIGSSKDIATDNDKFFNISEIGADMRLTFPRILLPFNMQRVIPYNMLPNTSLNVGFSKQTNIGLDKENLTATFNYNWQPKKNRMISFDLFSIQYINNLNVSNYYNVYQSSYNQLNNIAKQYDFSTTFQDENGNLTIPVGADFFILTALRNPTVTAEDNRNIVRILERKNRLIQNNLIFSSAISYSKSTRSSSNDNSFSVLKLRLESSGSLFDLLIKNKTGTGPKKIFEVPFSQFVKTDVEFTKQWDLKNYNVLAVRGFVGFAKPFGNSQNIPFIRSYFAGGANDIRAWRPYSLGPGRSEALFDFNEANLKLTFNMEYRFRIYKSIRGALFTDAGNIWHLLDDLADDDDIGFKGFSSLKDIALATGFGLRYDLSMFVIRADLGFKTYNPALPLENRWFTDFKLDKSVLNIGVNYPF